ncbi:MAG: RagB/SusD family nutrient uptake outer membrane protein [Bacteroidota bacterium]
MKYNKFIISIIALAVTFISCTDAIDIEQPGILGSDAAYQTVDDLKLGLIGCYKFLDNTVEMRFNAVYTDEISIGFDNGGQAVDEYALELYATSYSPLVIWSEKYIAISHINKLIEATANITPEEDEIAVYNDILGQAHALRAYLHFELLTYFSTDLTDDSAIGVPALNYNAGTGDMPARNTNGEVYDLIFADLQLAQSLLDNENEVTFVGKDFVTALKARVSAYRGDYTNADIYASELLTKYPIADRTQFLDIFTDDSNQEIIFKLERSPNDNYDGQGTGGGGWAGSLFAFSNTTLSGSPFLEMSRSLFNLLDTDDIRYDAYVDPTSLIDPDYLNSTNVIESDKLAIRKYPGSDGQNLMNDIKIFRSSEMLFLKAEAKTYANDLASAAALLKQLKDARFGYDTGAITLNSQQEAYAEILNSRRLELAFEGFRWVDLKRLGEKANVQIDRDPRDCEINNVCTMPINDYRFTLPIPLREMDANNSLVQNPGY